MTISTTTKGVCTTLRRKATQARPSIIHTRPRNLGALDDDDGRAALTCALRQLSIETRCELPKAVRERKPKEVEVWLLWLFGVRDGRLQYVGKTITEIRWNAAVVATETRRGSGTGAFRSVLAPSRRTPVFGYWHSGLISSSCVWRGSALIRETINVLDRL